MVGTGLFHLFMQMPIQEPVSHSSKKPDLGTVLQGFEFQLSFTNRMILGKLFNLSVLPFL